MPPVLNPEIPTETEIGDAQEDGGSTNDDFLRKITILCQAKWNHKMKTVMTIMHGINGSGLSHCSERNQEIWV